MKIKIIIFFLLIPLIFLKGDENLKNKIILKIEKFLNSKDNKKIIKGIYLVNKYKFFKKFEKKLLLLLKNNKQNENIIFYILYTFSNYNFSNTIINKILKFTNSYNWKIRILVYKILINKKLNLELILKGLNDSRENIRNYIITQLIKFPYNLKNNILKLIYSNIQEYSEVGKLACLDLISQIYKINPQLSYKILLNLIKKDTLETVKIKSSKILGKLIKKDTIIKLLVEKDNDKFLYFYLISLQNFLIKKYSHKNYKIFKILKKISNNKNLNYKIKIKLIEALLLFKENYPKDILKIYYNLLKDKNELVKAKTIWGISQINYKKQENFINILNKLENSSWIIKCSILNSIKEFANIINKNTNYKNTLIKKLKQLLNTNQKWEVKYNIIKLIGDLNLKIFINKLYEILKKSNFYKQEIIISTLNTLKKFKEKSSISYIIKLLNNTSPIIKLQSISTLDKLAEYYPKEFIKIFIDHKIPYFIRKEIGLIIGRHKIKGVIPYLYSIIQNSLENPQVKYLSFILLVDLEKDKKKLLLFLKPFINKLKNNKLSNIWIKKGIILSIGKLKIPNTLNLLFNLLKENNKYLNEDLLWSITKFDKKNIIHKIIEILKKAKKQTEFINKNKNYKEYIRNIIRLIYSLNLQNNAFLKKEILKLSPFFKKEIKYLYKQ